MITPPPPPLRAAAIGEALLHRYRVLTGRGVDEADEITLPALFAVLRHYCDARGLPHDRIAAWGELAWAHEVLEDTGGPDETDPDSLSL